MSEPQKQAGAIFDRALDLPPEQRASFLEQACAGDAALLQRVEALLRGHDAGGFMAQPAVAPFHRIAIVTATGGVTPPDLSGERIGRYKLLQQIGEGGCGVVYMAEQQEPVKRRVALKVIKLGMDTKQVIARFEAERQALALMDHPSIAKVLDAGATETGRPFFVMELVRGIKITDYCDQNNLSAVQRLNLFIQVCQAVQHAHQKGIIHRDLKPSNILVTVQEDGTAAPKIIDFGIAKATAGQTLTDKTLFTAFEQFIGTPNYMSPEQAEMSGLDIDTRSDIYSLGVLLYELLTGRTPFDHAELMAAGLEAMRRTIREQDPPKPSTRLSAMLDTDLTTVAKQRRAAPPKLILLVKGDLDWIVMKSLDKDRTRRYEMASSFGADVEHFLKNEPVMARSPSTAYRFQKLVRRNKLTFVLASAVTASLVAGLVASTWMFFREKEARRMADREAKRSEQVATFLEDMLRGVAPAVAVGRDTTVLREILDKTAARVATDLRDQPEVQAEICNTLGEVYRELGLSSKAEEFQNDARGMHARISGGKLAVAALSLDDLGLVLCDEGRLPEAESLHRQALELRRKINGNMSGDVAISLNNLAIVLHGEDKLAEAERTHREALAIQEKLFGHDSLPVATSLNNLWLTLRDEGRFPEAETALLDALAIEKHWLGENDPRLAITMDNLALELSQEGRLAEAATLANQSLDLHRKLFGAEHPAVATALNNLALVLAAQGQLAEAERIQREALAMRCKLLGEEHPEVAAAQDNLAHVLEKERKLDEAETLARSSLALRRKIFGDAHSSAAASLDTLALVLRDEGKLSEAETSARSALAIRSLLFGADSPSATNSLLHLGSILKQAGKANEARALEVGASGAKPQ